MPSMSIPELAVDSTDLLQEHIVQWHPTILTKLALIPQKLINAYSKDLPSRGGQAIMYEEGDFIVKLEGCDWDESRNCEKEFDQYFAEWKKLISRRQ